MLFIIVVLTRIGGMRMPIFFFTDLLAAEGEDERNTLEAIGFAELVDEILLVGFEHELGFVDEENKMWGFNTDLREVVDAEASSLKHGRMIGLDSFFDEAVEFACGDTTLAIFVDLLDVSKNLVDVSSCFCRSKKCGAVAEEAVLNLEAF